MPLAKSKNAVGLGNSLMNDRFGKGKGHDMRRVPKGIQRTGPDGQTYVTTPKQEAAWMKMRSVTEQPALDEFLSTAELAGTDFEAEKINSVKIIHRDQKNPYLLSAAEERATVRKHQANKKNLRIPRRPPWDAKTTAMELDEREKESLLDWRRGLAELQDTKDLLMTPFERNLEVWRQLWRVIERSDLVVQIVDARNPLLFRCEDLESYVKEVDPKKNNLLLVNKADMMTLPQRRAWASYFKEAGINYKFFSAELAKDLNVARGLVDPDVGTSSEEDEFSEEEDEEDSDEGEDEEDDDEEDDDDDDEDEVHEETLAAKTNRMTVSHKQSEKADVVGGEEDESSEAEEEDDDEEGVNRTAKPRATANAQRHTANKALDDDGTRILTTDELEELFLQHAPEVKTLEDGSLRKVQIGLVGYPNVGKSSTINALIGAKKVSVSATPGKTKHFQTIHLSEKVILCDCPGLVYPNFASTKAELVCNGVLPIDQLREHTGPSALVAQRIPQSFLEAIYGMKIEIRPLEEGGTGLPTGEEVLRAYAKARGFATQGQGQPDESRAARHVLKDYVKGKLLYCHPPPRDPPIDGARFNQGLYDTAHLPLRRQAAGRESMGDRQVTGAGVGVPDMVSLPPREGLKTQSLDSRFFARGQQGNAGHMSNPFQIKQQDMSTASGKHLSGRKLKAVVALERNIDPEDLRTSSKKHFKGNKRKGKARTEYT